MCSGGGIAAHGEGADGFLVGNFLEFEGEDADAVFEFDDAGFEGVVGEAGWFVEVIVHGDAGQFGDGADAVGEAELAKAFVFLLGEAEADHATAGFERHIGKSLWGCGWWRLDVIWGQVARAESQIR